MSNETRDNLWLRYLSTPQIRIPTSTRTRHVIIIIIIIIIIINNITITITITIIIIIMIIIIIIIVSITKFSIVIGSPRAYLSRNRRAITWVSNYRCPI